MQWTRQSQPGDFCKAAVLQQSVVLLFGLRLFAAVLYSIGIGLLKLEEQIVLFLQSSLNAIL